MNILISCWTEDDSVFIDEYIRVQIIFLLLIYCFTGARIETFLENDKAEVQRKIK